MRNKINALIKQITVPSPFAVGPTNTYLIIDEPITLIDTGPATREAKEYLNKSLADLGYTVKDIERIILTHAHLDHFGLARWISDISGAQVYIHEDDQYNKELYKHHELRKEIIASLIKKGYQTVYEISRELFGDLPAIEVFLAVSEVIAHIELLETEGKIKSYKKNGIYFYKIVK